MTIKQTMAILTSKDFDKVLHSMSMDKLRAMHRALTRANIIQAHRSKVIGKRL